MIVERYIRKRFLHNFYITISSLTLIYLVVDFLEKIDDFLQKKAHTSIIFKYFLLKFPFILSQMFLPSVYISSFLSIFILERHREITALQTLGFPRIKVAQSLLLPSILLSAFFFILYGFLSPISQRESYYVKMVEIKGKAPLYLLGKRDIWYIKDHYIYKISFFDAANMELHDVSIFMLDKSFYIRGRIDVKKAVWNGKEWIGKECEIRFFGKDNILSKKISTYKLPLKEPPKDIQFLKRNPSFMTFSELERYIKMFKKKGYDIREYERSFWERVTFPVSLVILSIIGSLFGAMRNKVVAFFTFISVSFLFWFIESLSFVVEAKSGLPPAFCCWFSVIFLITLFLVMTEVYKIG